MERKMWKNNNLLFMNKRIEESKRPPKRMRESVGAVYTITFYGIKLQNTKLTKAEKDKYGYFEATFTSEIKPKKYNFSCDHSNWSINSEYAEDSYIELDNGDILYLPITEADIIRGTVIGTYETSYKGNGDWEDYWKESIEEIESENYEISAFYGSGYTHSAITKTIELSGRYGIANDYLDSAKITFSDETVVMMNDCIDLSRDPDSYNYEPEVKLSDEDYDEGFTESRKKHR